MNGPPCPLPPFAPSRRSLNRAEGFKTGLENRGRTTNVNQHPAREDPFLGGFLHRLNGIALYDVCERCDVVCAKPIKLSIQKDIGGPFGGAQRFSELFDPGHLRTPEFVL